MTAFLFAFSCLVSAFVGWVLGIRAERRAFTAAFSGDTPQPERPHMTLKVGDPVWVLDTSTGKAKPREVVTLLPDGGAILTGPPAHVTEPEPNYYFYFYSRADIERRVRPRAVTPPTTAAQDTQP